jgi:hypothetical protein
MRRSSLPWLVIASIAVSAILAWLSLTRGGVAPVRAPASKHLELAPFHELEVGGAADVVLVQGDREAIDVEAEGRATVAADVAKGRLVVRSADRRRWWNRMFGHDGSQSPTITVHLRNLDALLLTGTVKVVAPQLKTSTLRIAASGGASLTIDDLRATTLRVDGSGALKAELAGRVDDEHVSISGAGSYHAERLQATNATVSVSGVGKVIVHAERTLRASISGAGLIEYVGDPEVTERVSGVGRVRRHESAMPGMRIASAAVASAQCSGAAGRAVASLNSSGAPVSGSTSPWSPARNPTLSTRQSRSIAASIAITSWTGSYG